MNEYFLYIIKVSVVQSVFYLFYLVFLKKRTAIYHQRIFLMTSLAFSFIIPFIRITHFKYPISIPDDLMNFNETLNEYFTGGVDTAYSDSFNITWLRLIYLVYFIGMMICIYRFFTSVIALIHLINRGTIRKRNHFRLVFSDEAISPFTFFHYILINKALYSDEELRKIITHEHVHVRQLHSLDILLVETIQILAWFNPVLSYLKKSVRAIHEYIADRHVIESGTDPLEYQLLLIRQNLNHKTQNLTSHLNVSFTKKRIMMLTDYQNKKSGNNRYLLVIPLMVFMMMAFSYQDISGDKVIEVSSGLSQSENRPCMMPVEKDKVKVTSGYGMRMHPLYKKEMMHSGIDLAAPLGTPVMATADGMVKEIADEIHDPKGYGKFIVIVHDQTYATIYAQLSEVLIEEKQSVKKGEIIGRVGQSGLSTAPHLHYEVWKNNEKVNPADYFQ